VPIPKDEKELAELFRELGARDPEGWAASQASRGINQLHRFLFLRQAWERVVSESDDTWIDLEIANSKQNPGQPFAGVGHALARLQAMGASREDIVDLTRGMQARLLFDICYLLADPSICEPSVEDLGWALVETDEDFEPTGETISGLHESVLNTDPTGREMRPRNAP
jgi:hypothetical protein